MWLSKVLRQNGVLLIVKWTVMWFTNRNLCNICLSSAVNYCSCYCCSVEFAATTLHYGQLCSKPFLDAICLKKNMNTWFVSSSTGPFFVCNLMYLLWSFFTFLNISIYLFPICRLQPLLLFSWNLKSLPQRYYFDLLDASSVILTMWRKVGLGLNC